MPVNPVSLPSRSCISRSLRPEQFTFANPIIPAHSADPWVVWHEGFYYHCESRNNTAIYVRKARCLSEISRNRGVCVWRAPHKGMNSRNVWAPELHFICGRWYIYYAADDGLNENHRMWVLESATEDPLGDYRERGIIDTGGWAIDGTVLEHEGQSYFLWSGWPGAVNGLQNLYISRMANPWSLGSERVCICTPDREWEQVDMPIAEAPQILKRDGTVFLVYSASGSWTVDYCLGMLVNRSSDFLNPSAWEKHGPVFQKTPRAFGVGHCSFVSSPDGREDWIVYHVKTKQKKGWLDRNVHAQPFRWREDGLPHFGEPLAAGIDQPKPSTEFPVTELAI